MKCDSQKLLLFDFDGVIVDSLEVYEEVVRQCFEKAGGKTVTNRADFLALYQDNFYREVVKRGIDLDAFMNALAEIRPTIDVSLIQPCPMMASILLQLAQRHRLMLISSNHEQTIEILLSRMNLEGCFEGILGSNHLLDKTEKILAARMQCGFAHDRIFYIGDTAGDIREARRAGVKTVAVTWGWHDRETLEAVDPDFLLDSASALLDLFQQGDRCYGR